MSAEHDHPHDHPDPHPAAPAQPRPQPVAAPGPALAEDAGTQALSEALRSSFNIVKFFMVALVVAFVVSVVFTVAPSQVAVKLRFGRPVGVGADQLLKPGLHWKLPYPVDEVVYIAVGESHTINSSVGWYLMTPEEELAGGRRPEEAASYLQPGVDGYLLSADGNIIHARATYSYRITDPAAYAFQFMNVTNVLQGLIDNALFFAASQFTADDMLYRNRAAFQELVLDRVRAGVDRIGLGVTVDPREIREEPPLYVQSAFNSVVQAQQRGDIRIQEAEAYARSITNKAVGEASAVLRDGMTRSNSLLQTVAAEAKSFAGLKPSYERDPRLFQKRLLAETVARVMTNAEFKTFLPQRQDGKSREVRLLLNKEIEAPTVGGAGPKP